MKIKKVFDFLGLWSYPLGVFIAWGIIYLSHLFSLNSDYTEKELIMIATGALILPLIITITNIYDYMKDGKTDFSPSLSYKNNVVGISKSKKKAMYPAITSEYLSDVPEGLIVGHKGKQYVRIPIEKKNIMNSVIIGSPGSGKSAGPFLCTLISAFMKKQNPFACYVLDIKPELYKLSVKSDESENVKRIDFSNRNSYGWDVYSGIDKHSSVDQQVRWFDTICRSLIVSKNEKDAFFVNNARTICKGLLYYHYSIGDGFIDSITAIVSENIMSHIETALADKEHSGPESMTYAFLKKYADMESEAFQDIELTLQEHLNIFLNSDVRWHLRDNPQKASPNDLNNGISVFVCLPLELLDEFSDVLRLLTNLTMATMQARDERDDYPIVMMIIDEAARIGELDSLTALLSIGRSKKVSVNLAFQDMNQLEDIYGKNKAKTIMNLSEVTYVLSCKDNATARDLSELIGDYKEEKISHNRGELLHTSDGKQNVSLEYRKIMEIADFQDLRKSGEAVLLAEGKYMRVKQLRYYQDPVLKKRYEEIIKSKN